jgi:hypothetical protein
MKLNVYVSMPEGERPPLGGLGHAILLPTGFRTWQLLDGGRVLTAVADAVASGQVASAYISDRELPADKPWLAAEFHRRVVVDAKIARDLEFLWRDWCGEHIEGVGVVVFSPDGNSAGRPDKVRSRSLVTLPEPSWWEIDPDDVERDPVGWFGEFGREDVGGWVTLLSAAVRKDQQTAMVGNLAALGLKLNRGADSLWQARASGAVHVMALALGRNQAEAGDFQAFGLGGTEFDLSPLQQSGAGYCVAVRIEAPVDPKVIIGSGTVFEQLGPGKAQNLAVANEWHDMIDAGQIVATVLPAWCINHDLPAPSGQPLRLTPLAFAGPADNQGAVWDDIDRRRAAARHP